MKIMHHPLVKKYYTKDLALFIIRIALGLIFIFHGWQKLSQIDNIVTFFGTLGLAPFVAYFVAALEFIGGLGILLGVFVRIFGILLAIDMFFAIFLVGEKMMKVRGFGAIEFEVLLFAVALACAITGGGLYSVMSGVCKCCDKCDDSCDDGSCCDKCSDLKNCHGGFCQGLCAKWKK